MDLEMFRQLVALDRAKILADQLTNVAKAYAPENKGEEIPKLICHRFVLLDRV